jgi:hypothetical protein
VDNILIRAPVIVASFVLFGVLLIAAGMPIQPVVIGVSVGGVMSLASYGRPSTRQDAAPPVSADGEAHSTDTTTTFTNVAFSKGQPTARGWSRDVGVVTITPQAISMVGKWNRITIDAPFVAELFDHKYLTWTMVRLTRSANAMPPATAYLVVRGAPRFLGAADPEVVKEESMGLVEAINASIDDPSENYREPAQEREALSKDAWFCIHCRNMNEDPELTRCSNCDRRRGGY